MYSGWKITRCTVITVIKECPSVYLQGTRMPHVHQASSSFMNSTPGRYTIHDYSCWPHNDVPPPWFKRHTAST
jgi:hypothetical protein